jgi:hypothetical protein
MSRLRCNLGKILVQSSLRSTVKRYDGTPFAFARQGVDQLENGRAARRRLALQWEAKVAGEMIPSQPTKNRLQLPSRRHSRALTRHCA